jgi:hypothetical protein
MKLNEIKEAMESGKKVHWKQDNYEGSKDIQEGLKKLVKGMSSRNIYSQLTYFMAEIAGNENNPKTTGHDMAMIIGLLSDSYLGLYINKHEKE